MTEDEENKLRLKLLNEEYDPSDLMSLRSVLVFLLVVIITSIVVYLVK